MTNETNENLLPDQEEQDATQQVYEAVKEALELFSARVASGELTPLQVAEIFSLSTTSMLMSMVPPDKFDLVQGQADKLVNDLAKAYDQKVRKRANYTYIAQVIAPARFATYVASKASETYDKAVVKAEPQPATSPPPKEVQG